MSCGLLLGVFVTMSAFPALIAPRIAAQTAAPPLAADAKLPVYDVVSIKPNKTGSGHTSIDTDGGNFNASNVSLKTMINNAYNLKEGQLVDLPKWAESSRYDIQAKVLEPDKKVLDALTDEQSNAMLQPILIDRFQLKFHYETKVLPVYELAVVKDGPKFQASKITGDQKAPNGMGAGSMTIHNTIMTSTAIPISSLVSLLSSQLQRMVIDKTGLAGKYDLDLAWSRDDGATPASDSAPPALFTALQEQLGLKLQPAKSQVETLVVDHIELPTEN
jgi:uncharacterized protein (TIGR03435 family)